MLNALKLYADNLLCMDLCGWSGVDAMKLLGEEVSYCSTLPTAHVPTGKYCFFHVNFL